MPRTGPEGRESIDERKMFGGIALMLDGCVCCGVELVPEQRREADGPPRDRVP